MNARPSAANVATTCPYCGVGCGVVATPDGEGGATIAGDPDHPANAGRLCVKGAALGETLGTGARLLHPTIHGLRTTWPRALDAVAAGFSAALEAHGPQSIAMYLSGQLLTEDYYVANKLMKGFLGSANVDTNSRLCMASAVAGHRRAFGADVVPGCYEDFDEADVIVFVGSNAAWCHPVLFQRAEQAKARRGTRIVTIDPRRSATAELADLHLSIAPGADAILFSRLLVEIADSNAFDRAYVEAHTSGFEQALAQARMIAPSRSTTAERCGLAESDLAAFLALWIGAPRVITAFSQGVNQSARGTDKVNAILNVHLATGRIGKPGCGPFSLTGQPNAMGGREVGGLANQLAAHMDFSPDDVDRVQRFWEAPGMASAPGLKAVELFEAIERGAVKALWIMSTNPAVSLPRADAVRAALGKLDFLVVSEVSAHVDGLLDAATVVLPAAAWGEKDGTVTNSERRISRQRPFRTPPGEAWPDWRQVSEVARRLGHGSAFAYRGPADIFREHAALSAFENDGARAFDIGELADLSDAEYDALAPAQWPLPRGGASATRFFAQGGFFHRDGRARFVAVEDPPPPRLTDAFGLVLNTGRVRDHWHTMTRTGLSPRLARHRDAPFVEVHPDDAQRFGLADGGFARVTTAQGQAELRVVTTASQRRGTVFAPIHWTAATAGRARVGALAHASVDPHSGQPDLKATPAAIAPSPVASEGFLVARRRVALPDWLAHARIAIPGGEAVTFASAERPAALQAFLSNWLGRVAASLSADEGAQRFQSATFAEDRLETLLQVAPKLDRAALEAAIALLARPAIGVQERRFALAGRTLADAVAASPLVCACFAVPRDAIEAAVAAGAASVEAVGRATRAGTNCGSCRAEIRQLLGSGDAVSTTVAEQGARMFAKTLDDFAAIAAAKAAYSRDKPLAFFISSMLAGAYVGIGIILIFTLGQQIEPALRSLVMGASFGIALTLVIFAGADLFTGHTMVLTIGLARGVVDGAALARCWIITWFGNFAGAVLLALVFWLGGGGQILKDGADLIFNASAAKMSAPAIALIARGALCNWLVCLALWTSQRATSDAAKCILIWWCLFAFIAAGFEHSVANMTVFSIALLGNHPASVSLGGMAYNLLWVTIGNIIGGAVFVAGGYLAASPSPRRETLAQAPAE